MACVYKYNGKTYDQEDFTKILLDMKPSEASKYMPGVVAVPTDQYKSTHGDRWDQTNILAWIRFDERTGPNGEKILHIAEIQADITTEIRKLEKKVKKGTATKEDIKELERLKKITPFHKSNKMVLLAIKRMVRYAAENGFDAISWDVGEVQADRYDLSKHLDKVYWNKDASLLVGEKNGREVLRKEGVTKQNLSDHIGKDVAEKLMIENLKRETPQDIRTVSGLDLKVGGEGLKSFYDRLLPNVVNKFFNKKAWGKAKVGTVEIPKGMQKRKAGQEWQDVTTKVHSLPITPEMKEKVLGEGMPLFSIRQELTEKQRIFLERHYPEKLEGFEKEFKKELPPKTPPKTPSVYEQNKDDWFAEKDWAEVRNNVEKTKLQNIIKNAVGKRKNVLGQKIFDKKSKDIDSAIHIYLDLKRNPAHREKYYGELPKEWQTIVDMLDEIETNPKLKTVAEYIRKQGDEIGEIALEADVIHNLIENHVNRVWKKRGGVSKRSYADALQKFKISSRHAKQRVFDTILEGLALKDENGNHIFDLQIQGATNNLALLKDEIARVKEDKKLVKKMMATTDESGNPLIIERMADGYKRIDHPNFTYWGPAVSIKGGEVKTYGPGHLVESKYGIIKEGNIKATKLFDLKEDAWQYISTLKNPTEWNVSPRHSVREKKQLYAQTEIAKDLNKILGVSKLKGVWGIDTLTKYNAVFKSWILITSFFHHCAFLRSYYLPTKGKTRAEWNPVKAYKMGKKAITNLSPQIELLVRNGLTMFKMQDWEESVLQHEDTIFGKILDKTAPTKTIKNKVNDLRERQANFLFGNFGAALKAQAALIELRNMTKKHPEMDINERAKMVARLINDDFGGLHLGRIGRDPTIQHIMRLGLLAPDWTESNVRTMAKAIKSGGPEETAMYRRFWASAITKGFAAIFVANVLLAATDDDDFLERYKKAWKAGHFRWMDIDITTIYKMFGGKSEARKYFSLFGHFRDPVKFLRHPIRSLHHKGSVVYGTFHEALAGTDWRGQRFTALSELIGIDDKGLYLTKTKAHKVGDPKGGRLSWKLTTYRGKKGPIDIDQIPSYAISQLLGVMPIQVQNLISVLAGEVAAFDGIARSLGLHTGTTYPSRKKTRAEFIEIYMALSKNGKSFKRFKEEVEAYNKRQENKGAKDDIIPYGSIVSAGKRRLAAKRAAGELPEKKIRRKPPSIPARSMANKPLTLREAMQLQ